MRWGVCLLNGLSCVSYFKIRYRYGKSNVLEKLQ